MSDELPQAVVKPDRRWTAAWIVPILALVLAAWLAFSAWKERGTRIDVLFGDAHGLRVGDALRYRGTTVGTVVTIMLDEGLDAVRVTVELRPDASSIARAGARFWIVRPEISVSGVRGLETVVGPRYIAVLPSTEASSLRREFVGLERPPIVPARDPADLECVLEAMHRGSLSAGAPVLYRELRIGTVVSVGLASDGGSVEARVVIEKAYRSLVREGSRFWDSGGIQADVGITGVSFQVGSILEVIHGSVSMATPPPGSAGEAVLSGHRFEVAAERDDDWLEWNPTVAIGSSLLPEGAVIPQPLRAVLAWRSGFMIKRDHSREGRVLQTESGVLGPSDLLSSQPAERMEDDTLVLEVAGKAVALSDDALSVHGDLAYLAAQVGPSWPEARIRRLGPDESPEDCIIVADGTAPPIPLAAPRLTRSAEGWQVDGAIALNAALHGAPVLARADGQLVGLLLIDDDEARVALLPPVQ